MTIKVIMFDFDGTIADSLNTIVSISNRLAVDFGYEPISEEELAHLKKLNYRQIIQRTSISIFKIPFLIRKVKLELNKEIQYLSLFPGIKEALLELKNQGKKLVIITSNSKENVIDFLEKWGLQDVFNFIYAGTYLFGKSRVINQFINQENLRQEETIYVGDETRDIEAARRSNIKAIAVSWGFNSTEALAAQNPDVLIHKPKELLEAILSL